MSACSGTPAPRARDLQLRSEKKLVDADFTAGVAILHQQFTAATGEDAARAAWLYGAVLFPDEAMTKITGAATRRTHSAWWVLAAYEAFKARGDRTVLEEFAEEANERLQNIQHPDLVTAQAWRTLGWMLGLRGEQNAALLAEQKFQNQWAALTAPTQAQTTAEAPALAAIFGTDARPDAFAALAQLWVKDPQAVYAVHVLRDLYGLRLWPDYLELHAQRPCTEARQALALDALNYRDSRLYLQLSGCGAAPRAMTVDGTKDRRIFAGPAGQDRDVVVKL